MIQLYHGTGSRGVDLVGSPVPREEWADLHRSVCHLLRRRTANDEAELLESIPFDLYNGTNDFGDEFFLLYLDVDLEQYNHFSEQYENPTTRASFRQIADTINEIGQYYIRFIAVDFDVHAGPGPVTSPFLAVTSDIVERALADCEQLIHSRGATSGVDRAHTAFHGYLRTVCTEAHLSGLDNASVTQLFKAIRERHPNFVKSGPRANDIDRVVNSMATIIDCLNPLRNKATLAHPNNAVLEEAEAMLVINSVRTLLHYIDEKLRDSKPED